LSIIEAIAEELCAEGGECGPFIGFYSAFNFRLWDGDINIKNI